MIGEAVAGRQDLHGVTAWVRADDDARAVVKALHVVGVRAPALRDPFDSDVMMTGLIEGAVVRGLLRHRRLGRVRCFQLEIRPVAVVIERRARYEPW